MKLILTLDGKEKYYTLPNHISGLRAREAAHIAEEMKKDNISVENVDQGAEFVCSVYGNKFTVEQFLEGTHAWFLSYTIFAVALSVLGKVEEATNLLNELYKKKKQAAQLQKRKQQKKKPQNKSHIQNR